VTKPAKLEVTGAAQPYRVSADDYLRMIDAGAFGDCHVELVDGVLIQMAPSNTAHGRMLLTLGRLLGNVYEPSGCELYADIITRFDESTIRAPDIAVVDRDIGERRHLHPADILLAVEIAEATLLEDLGRKRIDYATAGIRHYWVVDLAGRRIHCYADPQGCDYAATRVMPFGDPVPVPATERTITLT
jgi:Uma2 family endonuclease